MNYAQTLDYLFSQLPMFQRIGAAAYKKDLTNTLALCTHLNNPQTRFNTIHIAGTNGKGSTSHMLAAMLQAAGYKTGLYTSPHYLDFRERIKVNGKLISKKQVVSFVTKHKTFLEELQPSFFEMTVGLAFQHFHDEKVDWAIIETGLGGRLDSTNVIKPALSVITNISFDHMALLGDTLPLIANEKAGIIKHHTPVVIGERQTESIYQVFEAKAHALDAPLFCAEDIYCASRAATQTSQIRSMLHALPTKQANAHLHDLPTLTDLDTDLNGPYQLKNIQTALTAVSVLNAQLRTAGANTVTETHIRAALYNLSHTVKFMGRWQFLGDQPCILCDSAHNEAGLKYLFEAVSAMQFDRLHIVCGFANDKDLSGVLPLFPKSATYYFAKAHVPRGLSAESLYNTAKDYHIHGKPYTSVKKALAAAKKCANPLDLIIVTGSIFVLAEVLPKY